MQRLVVYFYNFKSDSWNISFRTALLSADSFYNNLVVLIYGGQSYIEDVDPDRPELGVRFVLLLPLADRPPKSPTAPVPVEELEAHKRKRGRGKGR